MKKYIVNILIFFTIVVSIDLLVSLVGDYLVSHVASGDTKRTNDLAMVDKHDILILGSSRARHHYDAPFLSNKLGLDVYNAGFDGNGVVLAYGILEIILERYHPQLIIYDVEPAFDINVYAEDNNHKRYISRLKPYFRHKVIGDIIKDVSTEEWYKVHSGMMRYNMSILTMLAEGRRNSQDHNKGFSPLNGIYDREPIKTDNKAEIDTFKLEYINKLITLAQERLIPIVLVASPKYGQINSADIEPVKGICADKGVTFLDYYADEEFQCHKELFNEPMHLNADGARSFSEKLAMRISTLVL